MTAHSTLNAIATHAKTIHELTCDIYSSPMKFLSCASTRFTTLLSTKKECRTFGRLSSKTNLFHKNFILIPMLQLGNACRPSSPHKSQINSVTHKTGILPMLYVPTLEHGNEKKHKALDHFIHNAADFEFIDEVARPFWQG
jgi:hypothetical protein